MIHRLSVIPWSFFVCAVFLFAGAIHHVDAATLSKTDIPHSEFIEITGSGFGPPAIFSKICFDDGRRCSPSTALVKLDGFEWSDTRIRTTIPSDIPLLATMIIYVEQSKQTCYPTTGRCITTSTGVEKERLSYRVVPTIKTLKPATMIVPGSTVTIIGNGFGNESGTVMLGTVVLPVKKWAYKEIEIEIPQSVDVREGEIIITTQNALTVKKAITLVRLPVSKDEFSGAQAEYLEQIAVPKAWERESPNDKEVIVAVLDDGVYLNHPDLVGRIWQNKKEIPGNGIDDDSNGFVDDYLGYNFVDKNGAMEPKGNHGTMIAGIIGAVRNNGIGIAGIASKVKIMSVIVSNGKQGVAISEGVKYAIDNGADIINISFGSFTTDGYREAETSVYQYAFDRGVIVVNAGGNNDHLGGAGTGGIGNDLNLIPSSPLCNNNKSWIKFGVTALDNTDQVSKGRKKAEWASYGNDCVNIAAPGVALPGTIVPAITQATKTENYKPLDARTFYALSQGSSFSAPIIAGVAALLKSTHPHLKNWEIINRVIATSDATDGDNPGLLGQVGGRVNAYRALTETSFIPSLTSVSPLAGNTFDAITVRLKNYFSDQRFVLTSEAGVDLIIPQEYLKVQAADKVVLTIPPAVPTGSYSLSLSAGGQVLTVYPDSIRITQARSEQKKSTKKEQPSQVKGGILVSHDIFYELTAPNGTSFGDARIPEVSYICFNDVNHCYDGATFHDIPGWSWGPTKINFQLFDYEPIDIAGNILIIQQDNPLCDGQGQCVKATTSQELYRVPYKVVPSISGVIVPSLKKGAVVTIEGNGFGKAKESCVVDDDYVTVKKWSYKKVECILPYALKPGRHYFIILNSSIEAAAWAYDVPKPKPKPTKKAKKK